MPPAVSTTSTSAPIATPAASQANPSLNAIPGENVQQYETRMGAIQGGGTGTGFGAPSASPAQSTPQERFAQSVAGPNGQSQNDSLAQQLGYANYADAISKLTAPPQSVTDLYNSAYSAAGLADLQNKITSRQNDLAQATANINDNPWLDEASRVGRNNTLQTLADADIKNWQDEYNSKLATVHDLVTQQTADANMTDTANKARLSYLETQAKANSDALMNGPKTITGGDGATYAWNPTTQSFDQIVGPKTSYQVIKGNNVTDAFGNTTTTPDRIFNPATGQFVDTGTGTSGQRTGGNSATTGVNTSGTAGTGTNKLDFNQYGLLANTNLNPSSSLDQLAMKYLDTYLKDGTVPTYTSLGRGISPSGFAQVTTRAQDLYFKATGSSLPTPQIIKGWQNIITNNNKLGNALKIQEQTVGANVDLSIANMKKNNLNSTGFQPFNAMLDTVQQMFQDPNVGQLIAQNITIQNELGSLLAVKNAAGTTVYDKLASAGIISSSDSQQMVTQKVNALLQEAANFADSLTTANAGAYKMIDPLMQDPNNPARAQYLQSQPGPAQDASITNDIAHAIKDTANFPTREALISALVSHYGIDQNKAAKMVYSQWKDNQPRQ